MENKRKEAIEKYSKSIKGQFDYTVESAHVTGFMAGYDDATSGPSGIGSLYDPRFGGISNNKNPHRGSSFNDYKYESLLEDYKNLEAKLELYSYRYKRIEPLIRQMGGWANFCRWVLSHLRKEDSVD